MTALSPALMAMAGEAGFEVRPPHVVVMDCTVERRLARFAALVAAAEREDCAALCDELGNQMLRSGRMQARAISRRVSSAIRARGLEHSTPGMFQHVPANVPAGSSTGAGLGPVGTPWPSAVPEGVPGGPAEFVRTMLGEPYRMAHEDLERDLADEDAALAAGRLQARRAR